MIYVDSNIFIYLAAYPVESREHINSRKAMHEILKEKENILTSALTWDEIVYAIRKIYGKQAAAAEGKKLLEFPRLHLAPVTKETIRKAQELVEEFNLLPRDSIHAACALENACSKILSNDTDFDKIKSIKRISI